MADLLQMTPHTAAKHLILQRYLGAWFPILGKTHKQLNYIDGFAGPGKYCGGEPGSPVIAIKSARAHIARKTLSPDTEINFVFIEANAQSCKHLEATLSGIRVPSTFKITIRQGAFRDSMEGILDSFGEDTQLAPTFAFVDPFGFSGIPFDLMVRILRFPKCEVLINLMVSFVNRFIDHPNGRVVAHVPETFGTDRVFDVAQKSGNRVEWLLSLYLKQLRSVAKYADRFDMRNRSDLKTYSLFFASNSRAGFHKMKEAMWNVDKHEGSEFSDADIHGSCRFDLFGLQPLKGLLVERYGGCLRDMDELEAYVIEQTRYLPKHLRKVLAELEASDQIVVHPIGGYKRRKGTFKSGSVRIEFIESNE